MSRTVAEPAVRLLARAVLPDVPAMADRLVGRVLETDIGYRRLDDAGVATLRESCDRNIRAILEDIIGGYEISTEHAVATAKLRAEQGIPLGSVLHAYRMGFEVIWVAMIERARGAEMPLDTNSILDAATTVWQFVDAYSQAITDTYADEFSDQTRRDEQRRTLILEDLLAGRHRQHGTSAAVAVALGLPVDGPYLVVVADARDDGLDALPGVEGRLRREAIRSAWLRRPDELIGVVAHGRGEAALDTVLAGIATGRVATSPPFVDLEAAGDAAALAAVARAGLPPGQVAVTRFGERPVSTLAAAAPGIAGRLAAVVLGPVLELPTDDRELLLGTFETWVASGGSTPATADALFCHRNTVRNRLARFEELTGRRTTDPAALAELVTAVAAARLA